MLTYYPPLPRLKHLEASDHFVSEIQQRQPFLYGIHDYLGF